MTLGMSLATFTLVHVILSLIGIAAGLVVLGGMLGSKRFEGWTAIFLVTTILTSVTGFLFPFTRISLPHVFGVISLAVPGLALVALYLNVCVGVVQAFLKIPFLTSLAPTQSEPPFFLAQLLVLAALVVLGTRAVGRFRPTSPTL